MISADTMQKVEDQKELKNVLNNCKTRASKKEAQERYNKAHKDVRRAARKDKTYIDKLAQDAQAAAVKRNMKELYDTTRKLSGKHQKATKPVKSKDGQTLPTVEEQLDRWVEHLKELLNRLPPENTADIPPAETPLNINCNRPSKTEIRKAIKALKNNKAPGPDNIPAEALEADINTSTNMQYMLFGKIWNDEEIPVEWREGHIVKLPKKGDLIK